jgi:hypothetical protein
MQGEHRRMAPEKCKAGELSIKRAIIRCQRRSILRRRARTVGSLAESGNNVGSLAEACRSLL